MTPVTQLLEAANRGDRVAAAVSLPVVYGELRSSRHFIKPLLGEQTSGGRLIRFFVPFLSK